MTHTQTSPRPFRVRARHQDAHHGRIVQEASFEAAAIAYAEHLPAAADDHRGIGIIVHDLESGHEHSFVVHVDTGEAEETG